jgi:hypothetical protein
MTTFEEMILIMENNGWELINKKSEYEKLKRDNKIATARIGWFYFKLKQDEKDLQIKFWKEKYENATRNFAEVINSLGDLREKLNKLAGERNENNDSK